VATGHRAVRWAGNSRLDARPEESRMSSLARHIVRITVTAAAMAALGAGLAGYALAAPSPDTARTSTSNASTARDGHTHTVTHTVQTSSTQDPDDALAQLDSTRLVNDLVGPAVGQPAIGGSTLGLPLG
jgi:hypothetical protein